MTLFNRKIFFSSAFFIALFVVAFSFSIPRSAEAFVDCSGKNYTVEQREKLIRVSVPIPGVTFVCVDSQTGKSGNYIEDMGAYIGGLYKFFSGIIGIIAAGMIFYAGVRWMTAGGNRAHVQSAKETIVTSLVAVALVLGSYLILFTINPKLVNLNPPSIQSIVGKEQQFVNCPTKKTCQTGASEGKTCTADADCGPAASLGTCGWSVDVFAQGTIVPECGKEYTYLKAGTGSEGKCFGAVCTDPSMSCSAPNPLDPIGYDSSCKFNSIRCEQVTDSSVGVGFGNHDNLCRRLSIAGKGRCGWYDEYWAQFFKDDRCIWRPILTCPADWHQVDCANECVAANKGCGKVNVRGDSLAKSFLFVSPTGSTTIIPLNPPNWLAGLFDGNPGYDFKNGKCDAGAQDPVYTLDLTTDKENVRSICCRKDGSTAAQTSDEYLKCLSVNSK